QSWFVYSAGTNANGQAVSSGSNAEGNVLIQPFNHDTYAALPEGSLSVGQVTDFINNGNKIGGYTVTEPITINTTQKQDEQIAANAAQSKIDFASGKEKYNLYSNNSTHAAMKVLNSGTGLDLKPVFALPKVNHEKVRETI